jgi:hypothetical protein
MDSPEGIRVKGATEGRHGATLYVSFGERNSVLFLLLQTGLLFTSWMPLSIGGLFKLVRSPGIDSKKSISPAYVAWRAGTISLFLLSS